MQLAAYLRSNRNPEAVNVNPLQIAQLPLGLQLPQNQSQMECQPHIRLVQVVASEFLNALQPIQQGVAMDEQRFRRLADVAMMLE
jgi:hypothetical protein